MTASYGYPPQTQYPPQPAAYPQPGYPPAPPAQFAYPQPGQFQQPAQQFAPPTQPLAEGSIDDFYSQPSTGGGKSLAFEQPGARHIGVVSRPITAGDVQQQTDTQGRPQFFRDGRPKFVMKVPLQVQPSAAYPDGQAVWYVKGQARDELVRAMAEAGAPAGPPEAAAIIDVTFTNTRPSGPGMNPSKQFAIRYQRPEGSHQAPAQPQQPAAAIPPPTQPIPQVPAQPQYQQPAPQQPAYPPAQQYQQPAPAQFQQPAQPQPATPTQPAMPADLSPDQQALLARLSGQQPPR